MAQYWIESYLKQGYENLFRNITNYAISLSLILLYFMKISKYIIWVFLLVNPFLLRAQEKSLNLLIENAFNSDLLLEALIDSAQAISPEVNRIKYSRDFVSSNAAIARNSIFSSLSLRSSYMYGTNYAAVNSTQIEDQGNLITNTQTGFYNIGVGLQLPLNQVINRKHAIKSGISQIKMAESEIEKTKLLVKQQVIEYYMELKLYYKLMQNSSLNKNSAEINYTMAEKEFLNGQLTLDQISRIQEISIKAQSDYETNLNRYQQSLLQLKAITGVDFYELLNTLK